MPGLLRQLLSACVVVAVWLSPAIAHAWIETRVESSQTALDLTADGMATCSISSCSMCAERR